MPLVCRRVKFCKQNTAMLKFSRGTISVAVFCLQNFISLHYYFCWSGLYRSHVSSAYSFAVLCSPLWLMFVPCLYPKILLKQCYHFLLDLLGRLKWKQRLYTKFWGANKVYYGRRANGEFIILSLQSRPKWAKCVPVFRPKRPKNRRFTGGGVHSLISHMCRPAAEGYKFCAVLVWKRV